MRRMTFGVIVSSRGFFPVSLAEQGRREIIAKLEDLGHDCAIVSDQDTPHGVVETYEDSKKCARLFDDNRDKIDGIIVVLPNFGDEAAVTDAITLTRLNVPVLVQAYDDDLEKMDLDHRRDSFCGKLSVCNNLYQSKIKFTNTFHHTCDVNSDEFTKDLDFFARVCNVVKGIKTARIGAIGTRPAAFRTVRFSEKLLQDVGITVMPIDLSDIISMASKMELTSQVKERADEIKAYGRIISGISEEKIIKHAKFYLTVEKWLKENECDASAIQCWTSIQENYGIASCLAMSMMGEKGMPSACETDIMGALSMYALQLASDEPSGYLDWNNGLAHDRNKCVNIHCSNYPKSFMGREMEIGNLDIMSRSIGEDICFGACKGVIAPGYMTFAKISTDDVKGKIKAYVGEGEFTDDPVNTPGGPGVCKVSNLQRLMNYLCENGFEHHVAMNRSRTARVLEEAFCKYLGWEVYMHK